MITHKHMTKIAAVIMALAVCLCLGVMAFSDKIMAVVKETGISMEYETALFDTDSVISVNILMDESDWEDMLEDATAEEYHKCNVEINEKTFYQVAIRPKGNTSLSSIANDPATDRYSFKLEFDHYVDGQTCFGLDKLILNNNYADATNMKEALVYDMYRYLGADASLYNYAKISVNGEYWGVYLALEAVEDSFLMRNYGAENGELYKPESMDMGGGFDADDKKGRESADGDFKEGNFSDENFMNKNANENSEDSQSEDGDSPSEDSEAEDSKDKASSDKNQENALHSVPQNIDESIENSSENMPPEGRPEMKPDSANMPAMGGKGVSNSGNGANLNYTDDDLDSYSTIWDGEVTKTKKADHKRVVTALKNISEGNDLESYMDIDNLLRYMAVHIFSVNDDSLSGMMAHNYYLYESGGRLNIIPWDYNLSFGGMGKNNDATGVVNDAIDNAFSGTEFFDTLMENETYHEQYYSYMQQLVDSYIDGGAFDEFYERVRSQIDELVEEDPTAFYSYEEYQTAADTLYQVVKLRGESIQGQLDGTIPSTGEEQKNSEALTDASGIDLSVMGSMNTGGGMGNDNHMEFKDKNTAGDTAQQNTAQQNSEDSTEQGSEEKVKQDIAENQGNPFDGRADSGRNKEADTDSAETLVSNLILYGITFLVLILSMIFVGMYRRKPGRK